MNKYFAVLGLILVTIIWGCGFPASDMALESLKPFQIMTIRFFLGTVCMGLLSIKQLKTIKKEEIKAGFLMGCALFAGFGFQIVGLQYTTASKNAFLTATNVVIVPFIAFVIYKKKVSIKELIGAVLAVIGVGVLSLKSDFTMGLGDVLTLFCAVGFAFQIFLTSQSVEKYRAAMLNTVQMATAFVLSLGSLFVFGETHFAATPKSWLSVLYLGLISTSLSYLIQTTCQKYVDETKAAIILSMESVFGTLFSIWLLHEQITGRMIVGCVMILAAVLIATMAGEKPQEA